MRIRTRLAGAIAGSAVAGLAAFAVGTATPASAQQTRPATQTVSMATQQPTAVPKCWGGDCWGDDDWGDDWDGGWYWNSWYGWGW
jgi:hypothetical protein